MNKKIISIIGARPQFIKSAVLSKKIRDITWKNKLSEIIIHTGQHYDYNMSKIFFDQMMIPEPDYNLEVGSGRHGKMTGEMIIKIEELLIKLKPDIVIVYGDTNTTLAGSITASKLNIPLAHIEAGLRSYNNFMPEEKNRIVTDILSDLLFCPTRQAFNNLNNNYIKGIVNNVGDVMYESFLFYSEHIDNKIVDKNIESIINSDCPKEYFLLTLHRAENTENIDRLKNIIRAFNSINVMGIYPVHPRTKIILKDNNLFFNKNIIIIDPVGYLDMIFLLKNCKFVATDSGGLQKEAYFAKKPCITLRNETEWPETLNNGWNRLVSDNTDKIISTIDNIQTPKKYENYYGDGNSSDKILNTIDKYLNNYL
jgi:UDP-GlcNAc3NAcA epimerase